LEQKHFAKNGTIFTDYEMVIQTSDILPDQVALIKMVFNPTKTEKKESVSPNSKQSLEI